jgi:hypothetical protein
VSWFCWVGVAQAVVLLFIFKYWNFFVRLVWFRAAEKPYWTHASGRKNGELKVQMHVTTERRNGRHRIQKSADAIRIATLKTLPSGRPGSPGRKPCKT